MFFAKENFDDFINKQAKKEPEEPAINWSEKKETWLSSLDDFYSKIDSFLKEYIESNKIKIKYSQKDIFEDYIGSYSAKVLDIELGNHKVRLEPIGTNLIGANGRVDLIGANGKIKFVLVNKDSSSPKINFTVVINGEEPTEKDESCEPIELDWKIATSPPRMKYINFEQSTFLEALMEVVGG